MARRNYTKTEATHRDDDCTERAYFMRDLLAGTIQATALYETRRGRRLELSYDEPEGERARG